MSWITFIQELESFFSSVGQVFLQNIKAAIPVLEQAVSNFLSALVAQIVADIENGTIPLPVLAAEPGTPVDPLALGKRKRDAAFTAVTEKLKTTTIPDGMVISNSMIYWQIETSVRALKNMGNGGNFPGGNSGPVQG
jgi:hypothetical protein